MEWILVPAVAFLNRYRGGLWPAKVLRKVTRLHPRVHATAVIAGLLWWFGGWQFALVATSCYFISILFGWGRFFDLGRHPDDFVKRPVSWHEHVAYLFPDDYSRFCARHLMFLLPSIFLLSPAFGLLPFIIVAAYELSWRIFKNITLGEWLTGAVWGLYFVALLKGIIGSGMPERIVAYIGALL